MGVAQPWQDEPATEIDDLGLRARQRQDFQVAAQGGDAVFSNGDRLGPGLFRVDGIDLGVVED